MAVTCFRDFDFALRNDIENAIIIACFGRQETAFMMKSTIRKNILAKRAGLSVEACEKAASRMEAQIITHRWFWDAEYILLFVGCGSEINTTGLIQKALDAGKKVYLPKVFGTEMEFYEIFSFKDIMEGYKGIPEPKGDTTCFIFQQEMAEKTLMIMPGVAFDPERNRIGYGKGFYDKYLARHPELQSKTIAVGFQCQMVEHIPADERDIKPCQVILT